MATYTDDDATALTVVADDTIKELLKTGNLEEIQKAVQDDVPTLPAVIHATPVLTPGQMVGKYEIIKKIGKGGMGVIYLARHTQLDSLRALKVLPAESADEHPLFAERFIREARIASQIRHPNVVEVMDVESDSELNLSYIVMEYVDGGSLRQVLRSLPRLSIEQAVVTVQGISEALSTAYSHGIVHRDIKPDNIMFTKNGGVKLADLGIAKKDDEEDNLTKTNVMMGTPAYLSPEQVENPKAVDVRSDIYSLGATFYEILTGQVPYPGNTSYDILRKIYSDPVPDPRVLNPEIPGELAAIVMKMLAKDPQKRFQTPAQLIEALSKVVPPLSDTQVQLIIKSIIDTKGESSSEYAGVTSVVTGTFNRLRQQEKRKKILLRSLCGLLLAAICIGCAFLFSGTPEPEVPVSLPPAAEPVVPFHKPETASGQGFCTLQIKTSPAAALRLIRDNGQVFNCAGNRNGIISISELPKGRYELELTLADFISHKGKYSFETDTSLVLPLKPDMKQLEISGITGTKIELQYPDGSTKLFIIPSSGSVCIKELKKGSYFLKATHYEHIAAEKHITLEKDFRLVLQMEKIFKSLLVHTRPGSQAELLQDSQLLFSQKTDSNGKNNFPRVRKGIYELKITAPGCKTHVSVLHIERDTILSIPLEKSLYTLTIYGTPGAKGEIRTASRLLRSIEIPVSGCLTLNTLSAGKYEISFSKEGYISRTQELQVTANSSLQFALEPLATFRPAVVKQAEKKKGKLNIFLSAPEKLLELIRQQGVEFKYKDEPWKKARTFPFTMELPAGESSITIRRDDLIERIVYAVTIYPDKSSDVLLELTPKASKVIFSSNRFDTVFTVEEKSCEAGEEISIEPFREYVVSAVSQKQIIRRTISSTLPGEKQHISFTFKALEHPLQGKYNSGMKLFKEKKYKEALPEFLTAAKARHPEAVMQAALIYEQGLGMWFADKERSLFWYQQAAEMKNPVAAAKVADAIYAKELKLSAEQMLKYYQLAAEADNSECAYKVSLLYKEGYKEIKQDDTLALKYLQKAAALEHPDAMYDLGIRYEKGIGVPFNSKTALTWIKKAADRNHDKAKKYWKQLKL